VCEGQTNGESAAKGENERKEGYHLPLSVIELVLVLIHHALLVMILPTVVHQRTKQSVRFTKLFAIKAGYLSVRFSQSFIVM
jgi:hypothetical protein